MSRLAEQGVAFRARPVHDATMFRITYSEVDGLLLLAVDSLLTEAEAQTFSDELVDTVRDLASREANIKILVDMSKAPVQSLASFAAINRTRDQVLSAAPTGVVVASTIAKMQAKRDVGEADVAAFLTMSEACEWLENRSPAQLKIRVSDRR